MLFNSIEFVFFLPIVFLLYWLLQRTTLQLQNWLIVGASYFFYGWWDWRFLSLIFFSTTLDYFIGVNLGKENNPQRRKLFLWTSILVNLGFLGFFKYYDFFLDNFIAAFSLFGRPLELTTLQIILPVGISFYTFQTLSYTIDVYKKELSPTKDFISFAAFVSFFPQLVAGPIERASHLLPQFYHKRSLSYHHFVSGLHQIFWGLFKKVVIADRLAIVVNEIYNYPTEYQGFVLVLGTIFFAFQIYCDFSAYSEIAIGTAKLFGFDLRQNFRTPYFSTSLSEFWRRWHISLSTWFKDYVYIPLGGNQTSQTRWYFNIFIVFVISGFWHGAAWTFIIWGAIHGSILIIESKLKRIPIPQNNITNLLKNFSVFLVVCFGWIFFRANTLSDAFHIVAGIFDFSQYQLNQLSLYVIPISKETVYAIDILLSILLIVFLVSTEYLFTQKYNFEKLKYRYRLPIYLLGIWTLFLLGVFRQNEFIYFQF